MRRFSAAVVLALAALASRRRGAGRAAAVEMRRHRQRAAVRDLCQLHALEDTSAASGPDLRRGRRDDHLCRAFDLHHRDAGRREDRHRFFRRLRRRPAAARRHHEQGAPHALFRPSGSEHRTCAARLESRRRPGEACGRGRRRLYPQRADRHPQLGRRAGARRQLDLHLRGGGALHRPSRPSAHEAERRAVRPDRPARHIDGADRWRHDAVARLDDGDHDAALFVDDPADAPAFDADRRVHQHDGRRLRGRVPPEPLAESVAEDAAHRPTIIVLEGV